MIRTLHQAKQLASEALTSVDGDVHVTLDQASIEPALASGQSVVLITPPTIDYDTDTVARATWRIFAIASNTDLEASWDALDALTADLAKAWGKPDQIEPAEWTDLAGTLWPAFTITITTDHYE